MKHAKPHILLIAYYFPPAQEIGALRPFRFYKYLQRMGYVCHVITASEQTAGKSENIVHLPDKTRGVWEGNDPMSLLAYGELLIRKAMFPGNMGLVWALGVVAQCRRIIRNNSGSRFVLVSTYPPLGVLLAGLLARMTLRMPWISDFRDPLAGLLFRHAPARTRFWNRVLEKRVFGEASAVLANTEGAALQWRDRYPAEGKKLHVIWNGFDPENTPQARELPARPLKVILHAGALYHGRNPNLIIASLLRLRRRGAPEATSVQILLLGPTDSKAGFDAALYAEAEGEGWLQLRAGVPKPDSQRLMEEADGLLLIQPQTDIQVPGKLFEYISIGRPILALVPHSSAVEQILTKSGIPHVCIYTDDVPAIIDNKLLEFLRLPTTPSHYSAWYEANFNATAQAEQLAAIIESVDLSPPSV